jgi:hypothetical protein
MVRVNLLMDPDRAQLELSFKKRAMLCMQARDVDMEEKELQELIWTEYEAVLQHLKMAHEALRSDFQRISEALEAIQKERAEIKAQKVPGGETASE